MSGDRILVIGGNAAGMTAASRAKRLNPSLEVTVVEAGSRIAYSICGLPYYLSGLVSDLSDLQLFTPDSLMSERGIAAQLQSRAIEIIPESGNTLSYHVLGEIAAGKPIEALDQREVVDLLPDAGDKDIFVLRVKGNSMIEDHIQNGDYVIVERRNVAENGETVVALIDNDRVTLKRFYREGERIRLQPSHPNMKPIFVREGDFAIQGVVISVLRKFDR